ncbi:hypothetical protein, partial [Pontitalea aquivivens]|uniref:hypothetical protein n=1 Tax=Pontitalea aquivivens TaxID=3388663 RepID=UPI00397107A9
THFYSIVKLFFIILAIFLFKYSSAPHFYTLLLFMFCFGPRVSVFAPPSHHFLQNSISCFYFSVDRPAFLVYFYKNNSQFAKRESPDDRPIRMEHGLSSLPFRLLP